MTCCITNFKNTLKFEPFFESFEFLVMYIAGLQEAQKICLGHLRSGVIAGAWHK